MDWSPRQRLAPQVRDVTPFRWRQPCAMRRSWQSSPSSNPFSSHKTAHHSPNQRARRWWQMRFCPSARRKAGHADMGFAAINSGENLLACVGRGHSIVLWNLAERDADSPVWNLEGHTNRVTAAAFTPDDSLLVSASFDRTVRLWNVKEGRQVAQLGVHPQFALGVAFSPDGARVASIAKEGTLRIWNVRRNACEHVLEAPEPYQGMNITGVIGISEI